MTPNLTNEIDVYEGVRYAVRRKIENRMYCLINLVKGGWDGTSHGKRRGPKAFAREA